MGIMAWGGDAAELFANAAAGLSHVICPGRPPGVPMKRKIHCEGIDLEGLLVAWLSEILFLFDSRGFHGHSFSVLRIGGGLAEGEVTGVEIAGDAMLPAGTQVKGITYHNLEIRRVRDKLRARVVFDV